MFHVLLRPCSNLCVIFVLRWEGEKENEVGRDASTDVIRVRINPKFYRPTEVVRTIHSCTVMYIIVVEAVFMSGQV